jgi:hypothetical protein
MKTEDLIEKLIYNIHIYKSKNMFYEYITITISENNIKKMIINCYDMFGMNIRNCNDISFMGNKIISSKMLKDDEIIIGQINKI